MTFSFFYHFNKRLFGSVYVNLQAFINFRATIHYTSIPSVFDYCDKYILKAGKFFVELIKHRPRQFTMTNGSLDVVKFYWSLIESYDRGNTQRKSGGCIKIDNHL